MVQIYHHSTEFPNQPPNGFTDLCTLLTCPASRSTFNYVPSLLYNLFLTAAFGLCCIAHVGVAVNYHTWGYGTAMVLGCTSRSASDILKKPPVLSIAFYSGSCRLYWPLSGTLQPFQNGLTSLCPKSLEIN
jgi:hypothetical protein